MSTAFSAPPTEETGITTRTAGVNIIPDEFGELPGAGGARYEHTGSEHDRLWHGRMVNATARYLSSIGIDTYARLVVICDRDLRTVGPRTVGWEAERCSTPAA